MSLADAIRTIPDYPKPGILFRDITTLLGDARAFRRAVDELAALFVDHGVDKVAGIEARGFVFGGALAHHLGVGFVPVRKAGKLPHATVAVEYALEYGSDVVEIHVDAVVAGERVLVVDDLIATGGTAEAAVRLLRGAGAVVEAGAVGLGLAARAGPAGRGAGGGGGGAACVTARPPRAGRPRLEASGVAVHTLVAFAGH